MFETTVVNSSMHGLRIIILNYIPYIHVGEFSRLINIMVFTVRKDPQNHSSGNFCRNGGRWDRYRFFLLT